MNIYNILLFLYIATAFLPGEIAIFLGDVRLEPYRVVLIISFFFILGAQINTRMERHEKWLLAAVLWACLSLLVKFLGFKGVERAGIYFLEAWVGFFLARNAITSISQFYKILSFYCFFILLLAPFALVESQTGYRFLRVLAAGITDVPVDAYQHPAYFRYGVWRAGAIFSHPILYAFSAVIIFPFLLSKLLGVKRFAFLFGTGSAMYASMTSAGFLMVILVAVVRSIESLSKRIQLIKPLIVYGGLAWLLFLEAFSNRGAFNFTISMLALNKGTAYMRSAQIDHSMDDILDNPIFGLYGNWSRPWWMPGSIDNYWINWALDYGIPSFLFGAIGIFILAKKLYSLRNMKFFGETAFHCYTSIVIACVGAFTVDLFDRAQLFFFMLLGCYAGFYRLALFHQDEPNRCT